MPTAAQKVPLDASTVVPVPLTAWIPVSIPLRMPGWPDDFDGCCADVQAQMPKLLRHLDPACTGFALWENNDTKVPTSVRSLNQSEYLLTPSLRFLKIQCSFEIRAGDFSHSDGHAITLADLASLAASIFAETARDIFVFVSIAYPSRFHTHVGQVFCASKPLNTIPEMPGFSRDHLYSEDKLWPEVRSKRLTRVINWEKKIGLFRSDVGTTGIQRALACYTRLQQLTFNDDYSMLFFAMQGLEAFYCRGVGDLRRQLAEKCKLFLGAWPTTKNIVGDLYNIRSGFVHGSYPILRANPHHGLSDKYEKKDDAVGDAASLAVRLLIASLHKCIDRGLTSVEFDWRVRSATSPLASEDEP